MLFCFAYLDLQQAVKDGENKCNELEVKKLLHNLFACEDSSFAHIVETFRGKPSRKEIS